MGVIDAIELPRKNSISKIVIEVERTHRPAQKAILARVAMPSASDDRAQHAVREQKPKA